MNASTYCYAVLDFLRTHLNFSLIFMQDSGINKGIISLHQSQLICCKISGHPVEKMMLSAL